MRDAGFSTIVTQIMPVVDLGLVLVVILLSTSQLHPTHGSTAETEERWDQVRRQEQLLTELQAQEQLERAALAQLEVPAKEAKQRAAELQNLEKESAALRGAIAAAEAKPETTNTLSVECIPVVNAHTGRKPQYVALIESTVVPVRKPYYQFVENIEEHENGVFERVIMAHRADAPLGESVAAALRDNSQFGRFLQEVDVERSFVALLVDPASFDAYRTTRQTLENRNIPFGWLPCPSPSRFRLGSGHGMEMGETVTE